MVKLRNKVHSKGKRAFTLVELIVVLIILAVLAAMIVPALTGYIKKTKRAKYIQRADEARVAAQAIFSEFYAFEDLSQSEVLGSDNSNTTANIEWYRGTFQSYGDRVLHLMGIERGSRAEPYVLVIGVGHDSVAGLTNADRTTVYYVAYMETKNSPAVFYVNGEWTFRWPKDSDVHLIQQLETNGPGRNTMTAGGLRMPLRFYVICNATNGNNYWLGGLGSLQGNSQQRDGTYRSGVRF